MSDLGTFLDAIGKLPAAGGLVYRGLVGGGPASDPVPLGVLAGLAATSRDPRVATQNFACDTLLVLLTRTGRDLSALSAHPEEHEVLQRPGSVWSRLPDLPGLPAVPGRAGQARVVVAEELDPSGTVPAVGWPDTLAALAATVAQALSDAIARPPVPVHRPGVFVGDWPLQAVER